jgi:hypothetical protein
MFKTAQEMLDQRRKDTQNNLLTIKAIEGKQRERPLSGYAKFGGMLGKAAGESLKDYLGVKSEGDYLKDYESGIGQRGVMEQNLRAEGSGYSPEVAAQALAQQDRFIEESGSNLTPEIKRSSDFTRAMRGLTAEDLNDPMKVAKVYNDFGYTKEAVELLQQNRMTPYQDAQVQLERDKLTQEEGFTPTSRLGKLVNDLEKLKKLSPTPSNQSAIAAIQKEINSEQVQYDTQLRELSGNIVKDFAGKGQASEVADWNKGIDLTTNLMSQYEGNPSKVRSHLNKYYRTYDGGVFGSDGFNVKEEYQKNVLTTQDDRAYYYDPDNKQFIGWAQ